MRGNGWPQLFKADALALPRAWHKSRTWAIARHEFSPISSGAPFLPTLSRALLDGRLIEGFPSVGSPMALADATIYVPTQRAGQALANALLAASGAQSLLLPRIAPLGAFEPDETATAFDPEGEEAPPAMIPPAVGVLSRRHALATLTRAWGKALKGAIRRADAEGRLVVDPAEPALIATTPAQAYALAGDLAALIDDMIIEDVAWKKLETLTPEAYDPYWRITLDFLKIAASVGPTGSPSAASSTERRGPRCSSTKKSKRSMARGAVRPSSPARPAPIALPPASSQRSRARLRARSCCPTSTAISTIAHGR